MEAPKDDQIPVLEASGSHHQVGIIIGSQMSPHIRTILAEAKKSLPPNISWEDMLYQSKLYLVHSQAAYPELVRELEGIAEGAKVPFEEIFLLMCEELWDTYSWQHGGHRKIRGCTDLAARGRATVNGATLAAHTNDLLPASQQHLVILKIQVDDEPEFIGVSLGGVGISAGFNAAGIGLTGNQVDSNDIRPGVPRLLLVRAILAARRLGEALEICLLPERASNYNNVISDSSGEIYAMEGSATDCEPIYINDDILSHANHYISPPMRHFEADRSQIADSVVRHNRAHRLLQENYGQLTPELMMQFLADHTNYPASICKHGTETHSVFSIVLDLNKLCGWIGRGYPCQTSYHEYRLEPWSGTPRPEEFND